MGTYYGQLSPEERLEISRLKRNGLSDWQIGGRLGRSRSTIWREVNRNKQTDGWYCPIHAGFVTRQRRQHDSRYKLSRQPALRNAVETRLAMGWSPEQIAGRLTFEDNGLVISHESIYRYIHRPGKHASSWHHYLIRKRKKRGWGKHRSIDDRIKNRVSIADRSEKANNRTEPGHWEADFMSFAKGEPSLLVLAERSSRYIRICLKPDKRAGSVAHSIYTIMLRTRKVIRRSVTFDNGSEFFRHMFLNHRLNMPTYFCDPNSPWQKGTVENTIGRLRRMLPLKSNIATLSAHDICQIENRINNTPRKCLGYKTPREVYLEIIRNVALQL